MNALEIALALKDEHGGKVSILSMGPQLFEPHLRTVLAMGADHIYLLSDRDFAGADTLATTYTLVKGVEKIGKVDLIICGEESSDGATGQVPPGIGEWLDISQITMVDKVEVDMEREVVRGRREIKGGYETLEVPLPAVISVQTASNEPRFMDFGIKAWAFEKEQMTVWAKKDLKVDEAYIGVPGSPTVVSGLDQAESRERKRIPISGTPEEIASHLAEILQEAIK
jgi:electron transfer flavoprotein beta subunit